MLELLKYISTYFNKSSKNDIFLICKCILVAYVEFWVNTKMISVPCNTPLLFGSCNKPTIEIFLDFKLVSTSHLCHHMSFNSKLITTHSKIVKYCGGPTPSTPIHHRNTTSISLSRSHIACIHWWLATETTCRIAWQIVACFSKSWSISFMSHVIYRVLWALLF